MRTHNFLITSTVRLALLATTFVATTSLATPVTAQDLLPLSSGDLASETLVASPLTAKAFAVPREAVAVSRPLNKSASLDANPTPFISKSKEYFVDVSAEDLARGVAVYTSEPGALVRLNPAPGTEAAGFAEKAAIAPAALLLISPDGRELGAGGGMDLMVGPDQLKAAGAPFAEGTSAFRIREDLGAGKFEIRTDGLDPADGRSYVMHVLDQHSDAELRLHTDATDYLHGQTLTVEATLVADGRKTRTRSIEGFVTSPGGRAWELTFTPSGRGVYRAGLTLDALETPRPGLWQVHASAQGRAGRHSILRAGRTAFSCAVPTARLSGASEVLFEEQTLNVRLAVEAASASRYEVRGILYGTAADGSLRPAGLSQSAAWLEAGTGSLDLTFGTEVAANQDLSAPYELRDLRLVNQVMMSLLHRQARALTIAN